MNGPTIPRRNKSPKGVSGQKARKQMKKLIHTLRPPAAGMMLIVDKLEGGRSNAEFQGSMITIAAGLRACAAANPKFKQVLLLATAKDPLSVTVPKIIAEQKKSSEEE